MNTNDTYGGFLIMDTIPASMLVQSGKCTHQLHARHINQDNHLESGEPETRKEHQ